MFNRVPLSLKTGMKRSVIQLSLKELQEDLDKNLQHKVTTSSLAMIASGLYSTNPAKGIPYLLSKMRKGRTKK
jgi:hypothetical protein